MAATERSLERLSAFILQEKESENDAPTSESDGVNPQRCKRKASRPPSEDERDGDVAVKKRRRSSVGNYTVSSSRNKRTKDESEPEGEESDEGSDHSWSENGRVSGSESEAGSGAERRKGRRKNTKKNGENGSESDESFLDGNVGRQKTKLTVQGRPRQRSCSASSIRSLPRAKKYTCTFEGCEKMFTRPCRLEEHMLTHSNSRPFVCEHPGCGHTFTRKCHLQRHTRTHTGDKRYRCTEEGCGAAFAVNHHLKRHMLQHQKGALAYKCAECDLEFSKHSLLRVHEFHHTGVHPFLCLRPGCGAGFVSRAKLERHMKSHDKSYKCDHEGCHAAFGRWSELVAHRNEVHGFPCTVCGKTFGRKSVLTEHMVTHDEDRPVYPCQAEGCDRIYTTPSALATHVRVHHEGGGRFVCPADNCNRHFAHKQSLAQHYDRVHVQGIDPVEARKRADEKRVKSMLRNGLIGQTWPVPAESDD